MDEILRTNTEIPLREKHKASSLGFFFPVQNGRYYHCTPNQEGWSSSSEFLRILKEFSSFTLSKIAEVTSHNHTITEHRKSHPANILILTAWNLMLLTSFKISVNVSVNRHQWKKTDTQNFLTLEHEVIKAFLVSIYSSNMHTDIWESTTECLVWIFPNCNYCFTLFNMAA